MNKALKQMPVSALVRSLPQSLALSLPLSLAHIQSFSSLSSALEHIANFARSPQLPFCCQFVRSRCGPPFALSGKINLVIKYYYCFFFLLLYSCASIKCNTTKSIKTQSKVVTDSNKARARPASH